MSFKTSAKTADNCQTIDGPIAPYIGDNFEYFCVDGVDFYLHRCDDADRHMYTPKKSGYFLMCEGYIVGWKDVEEYYKKTGVIEYRWAVKPKSEHANRINLYAQRAEEADGIFRGIAKQRAKNVRPIPSAVDRLFEIHKWMLECFGTSTIRRSELKNVGQWRTKPLPLLPTNPTPRG